MPSQKSSRVAPGHLHTGILIQNPENSQIKYNDEQSEEKIPYYTIQIMALHKPVSTRYFKNLDSVKVHKGSDLISRYTYGKFYGYTTAREYLEKVHNLGYSDAFIREINSISNYYENTSNE